MNSKNRLLALAVFLTGATVCAQPTLSTRHGLPTASEVHFALASNQTPPPAVEATIEDTVRIDLNKDRRLLLEARPSQIGALVFGITGGVVLAGGAGLLGFGVDLASRGPWWDFLSDIAGLFIGVVGVAIGIVGIGLLVVSMVKYFTTRAEIAQSDERLEDLERRIQQLEPTRPAAMPSAHRPTSPTFEVARF